MKIRKTTAWAGAAILAVEPWRWVPRLPPRTPLMEMC